MWLRSVVLYVDIYFISRVMSASLFVIIIDVIVIIIVVNFVAVCVKLFADFI